MEQHVKKISTSKKGNNVSKGIRHSYDADLKIMVTKHADQTTVKQQGNMSSQQISKGGNSRNKSLRMSVLCKNHSVALNMVAFIKMKTSCSVCTYSKDRMDASFM
jgi:hypothetical protein